MASTGPPPAVKPPATGARAAHTLTSPKENESKPAVPADLVDLLRHARWPQPRAMNTWAAATRGTSALLSQPDHVALRIGDQREAHSRCLPRFLHHRAAELCGLLDNAIDVIHADEEGDKVGAALQRADRGVQRIGHTSIDEGVARHSALAWVGPAEQVAEELASSVRVFRADLRVHDGVCHGPSLGIGAGGPSGTPALTRRTRVPQIDIRRETKSQALDPGRGALTPLRGHDVARTWRKAPSTQPVGRRTPLRFPLWFWL